MTLAEEKCVPCRGDTPKLSQEEAQDLAMETLDWKLDDDEIEREFKFGDFREAIQFVNRVADIAEEEDHHPDIYISYSKVKLELSTHKIGGLSKNDFILAAKIDQALGVQASK